MTNGKRAMDVEACALISLSVGGEGRQNNQKNIGAEFTTMHILGMHTSKLAAIKETKIKESHICYS